MQPSDASGQPLEPSPEPIDCEVVNTSFRDAQWRWSDVAIGLTPLVAINLLGHVEPHFKDALPAWASILVTLIGPIWILAYPLIMVRRRGVHPRPPKLREIAFEAIFAFPTLMSIWLVLLILVAIWMLLGGSGTMDDNPVEGLVRTLNPWVIAGVFFLAVVLAPNSEEMFFRGMIYNKMRTAMPVWLAIILQGLLFGFIHTFGVVHGALASILGIGLGVIYEIRKKLAASILVHTLQNFIAISATVLISLVFLQAPKLGIMGAQHADGLQITSVEKGSAADEAGLQAGDILKSLDGQPVHALRDVILRMILKRPGDKIKLVYLRDGQSQEAQVTLHAAKPAEAPPSP